MSDGQLLIALAVVMVVVFAVLVARRVSDFLTFRDRRSLAVLLGDSLLLLAASSALGSAFLLDGEADRLPAYGLWLGITRGAMIMGGLVLLRGAQGKL